MNKKQLAFIFVAMVIAGAGMFFAGRKFEAKKTTQVSQEKEFSGDVKKLKETTDSRPGIFAGEVVEKNEDTLTLKQNNGSLKKVTFTQNVPVRKTEDVKAAEINIGQQVSVRGSEGENGTLAAQNISFFLKKQ